MSAEDNAAAQWRAELSQSFRNNEVREISKVLAALDPKTTSASKLMLATRFEDNIFKSATSLADYRKKITKRLKKVQKSYVPPQNASASNQNEQIANLRVKYGASLRYIHENSSKAIVELRAKHGNEKATQLQQHTAIAAKWAADLGLLKNTKPNFNMPSDQIQKLQMNLERRADNIRSHVVKLVDPDRFLRETLQKTEKDMSTRAGKLLAMNTAKRYQLLQGQQSHQFEPLTVLKEAMESANASVPLPTRSQRNDEQAALLHLDKMRAASTLILAYLAIQDKSELQKDYLGRAHDVAVQGVEFVGEVMKNFRKEAKVVALSLEDAWNKTLEDENQVADGSLEAPAAPPSTKTLRLPLRSKVLLTAGRKTPSSLVPALKRKRATLVRPLPKGEGSHLVLEFEKAFVMTIYFVPLRVTLRACSKSSESFPSTQSSEEVIAAWTPLHQGLVEEEELQVMGVKGNYATLGHVVEEKLRDASAHATHVLRKGFATAMKDSAGDFEVEILEATALLEFLHLVRKTYMPNWKDADI